MTTMLDGKKVAQDVRNEVKITISSSRAKLRLHVIQVGDNPASDTYIKNKKLACEYVGIEFVLWKFSNLVTQDELENLITKLNIDKSATGIIVQLPLPKHLNEKELTQLISPVKDVDGFNYENRGKLVSNEPTLMPCTPSGVIRLLDSYRIDIDGKHAVVVGRSNIVGRPMAEMLLQRNATVSILHSKTTLKHFSKILSTADIIVSAVGQADFIIRNMINPGIILIDVGMNRDKEGKLCGDINAECYDLSSYYTPVPGGVGPMTVAMLMKNCLEAYKIQKV